MNPRWIGRSLALMVAGCGVLSDPARADEALAERGCCMACHTVQPGADKKTIGPAFREIGSKYRDNASARAALIQVVRGGGKGKLPE